jgi:hypothetical protein
MGAKNLKPEKENRRIIYPPITLEMTLLKFPKVVVLKNGRIDFED